MAAMNKWKRPVIWAVVLMFVILLSFLVGRCYFERVPIWRGEFSVEKWEKYPHLRHYMIKDMEQKIDIWNLTQSEIINILGETGLTIYGPEFIRYYIEDNILFFPSFYYIYFDDDGKVLDISIMAD